MLLPRSALVLANSRYFSSGVISAVGVALLGFITYALAGLGPAVALGTGALTVCFSDNPAPLRLKAVELLFTSGASTVAMALVTASLWWPPSQFVLIPLLGFVSGLIAAWGKRALAFSFSTLFISVITLGVPPPRDGAHWAAAVALFLLGALLYTAYALLLTRLLRLRAKRQALGELYAQLARYATWRAQEPERQGNDLGTAIALQTALNDTLQNTRDMVLRDLRTAADHALVARLLQALEITEALLASQSDAELIGRQFDGTDVPDALRAWTQQLADALDAQALAMLRNQPDPLLPANTGAAESQRIAQALRDTRPSAASADFEQARMALRARQSELQHITDLLRDTLAGSEAAQGLDLQSFVSPLRYRPRVIADNLRWQSPILRYSVRLALALLAGVLLTRLLPYSAHGYWILLTIGVILRPNFSVTRQRIKDRVLGTLLGCAVVAAFLALHPPLWAMALAVFVSLIFARTFITLNYRFTALSASVNALLLVALLEPGSGFLVTQRLTDTLVGAALAWAFSFVLPRWESRDLKRQLRWMLQALRAYAEVVLDPTAAVDADYRSRRKQLLDAIAAVAGLHARMLEEPAPHRRQAQALGDCIGRCYEVAAHLATLRVLRSQRRQAAPAQADRPAYAAAMAQVRGCLDAALAHAAEPCPPAADATSPNPALQRRLGEITTQTQAIARLARGLLHAPVAAPPQPHARTLRG